MAEYIIFLMNSQYFAKKRLPDASGVYFFLGRNKKILYIGKATSLRDRVRSYFSKDIAEVRSPLIKQMVGEAVSVDFRVTDSVLEALILEADLIKKFQPKYNTDEKDDKSFNCVVITKEDFPRILVVRKHEFDSSIIHNSKFIIQASYGPFPNGGQLKDALKIIRRIFPYRDNKCIPCTRDEKEFLNYSSILQNTEIYKPCFNRQIGLCPGVCTGEISKTEYAKTVRNIRLFFSGKKSLIVRNLRLDMKTAAKRRDFEHAGEIKRRIFALEHIQDIALIKRESSVGVPRSGSASVQCFRIESYDIAHISGTDVVGTMVVLENGMPKKSDYRKFKIRGGFGNNDAANLREIIERRLNHREWSLPALFVADGGVVQKSVIEDALRGNGSSVPVVAVTKNVRHQPNKILGEDVLVKEHRRAILLANSEAHRFALSFHRKRRSGSWL